jgi:plastocyanin
MKKLICSLSRSAIVIATLFAIFSISSSCTKKNMDDLNSTVPSKDIPGPKGGGDGSTEVMIGGRAFVPDTLTVTSGTTVTWTNKDNSVNIVISDDGLFGGVMSSNGTYSYLFSTVGNYKYFNRVRPSSTGIIIVN